MPLWGVCNFTPWFGVLNTSIYEEKSHSEAQKSAASKRRNSPGRFSKEKKGAEFLVRFCRGSCLGLQQGSSHPRLNFADQTCRSALNTKVPRVIHKTKEVHRCD